MTILPPDEGQGETGLDSTIDEELWGENSDNVIIT